MGAVPAWRAKCPSVREPLSAGGVADDDRGGHRPAAGLGKQLRAWASIRPVSSVEQLAFLAADLGDPPEQPSGDPQPRGLRQPSELTGQASADPRAFQRRWAQLGLELGCDRDQVPAQPVDHPGALADDLIAIVAQDADLHRVMRR